MKWYREIGMSESKLEQLSDRQLWPDSNDEYQDLQTELSARLRWLANNKLTAKQLAAWALLLTGLTQQQVADELGVTQSAISKRLLGNLYCTGPYAGQRHGGLLHKLQVAAAKDEECNRILAALHELRGM